MRKRFNRLTLEQQTVIVISSVLAALLFPYGFVELLNNTLALGLAGAVAGLGYVVIVVLAWRGMPAQLTGNLLLGILFSLLAAVNVLTMGDNDVVAISIPFNIFLATVIMRGWRALLWTFLFISIILIVVVLRSFDVPALVTINPEFREYPLVRLPLLISFLALITGLLYQWNNIFQRRRIEQSAEDLRIQRDETKLSETRFKDFAYLAADCLWQTDTERRISYVSPGFERLFKLPQKAALGFTLEELYYSSGQQQEDSLENYLLPLIQRQAFSDTVIHWNHQNGERMTFLNSGQPFYDDEGVFQGYRGVLRDYTEQAKLTEKLYRQASIDALTGLLNRRAYFERVHSYLQAAKAEGQSAALAYIDLDFFKEINDQVGHAAGDAMLVQVAEIFRAAVRKTDAVARLGGDEFSILFQDQSLADAQTVAERILQSVNEHKLAWEGQTFQVGVSIGLMGEEPVQQTQVEAWLSRADEAVYLAKGRGKGRVCLFESEAKVR